MQRLVTIALALAFVTAACGNLPNPQTLFPKPQAPSKEQGTTSSGGILGALGHLSCRENGIADAGYGFEADLEADGKATGRLSEITIRGPMPIGEPVSMSYAIVQMGPRYQLRLYSEPMTLYADLGAEQTPPTAPGRWLSAALDVATPDRTEPAAHAVSCTFALPTSVEARALILKMTGNGAAVDAEAYRQMRALIAALVADFTLGKYIVNGHGVEGGEHSCIQLDDFVPSTRLPAIQARFDAIVPNPATTEYETELVPSCP